MSLQDPIVAGFIRGRLRTAISEVLRSRLGSNIPERLGDDILDVVERFVTPTAVCERCLGWEESHAVKAARAESLKALQRLVERTDGTHQKNCVVWKHIPNEYCDCGATEARDDARMLYKLAPKDAPQRAPGIPARILSVDVETKSIRVRLDADDEEMKRWRSRIWTWHAIVPVSG